MARKKLIEVALPLAEINDASAYDKMPGIGPHPIILQVVSLTTAPLNIRHAT
jgi:adenine-specific DNA methylase